MTELDFSLEFEEVDYQEADVAAAFGLFVCCNCKCKPKC